MHRAPDGEATSSHKRKHTVAFNQYRPSPGGDCTYGGWRGPPVLGPGRMLKPGERKYALNVDIAQHTIAAEAAAAARSSGAAQGGSAAQEAAQRRDAGQRRAAVLGQQARRLAAGT